MKTKFIIFTMLLVGMGGSAYFLWQQQQQSEIIAVVNDTAIVPNDLAKALREQLWRKGKDWKNLNQDEQFAQKQEATKRLVEKRLLEQWTKAHPAKSAVDEEAHFQQFLKQFEPPNDWAERAGRQSMSEPQLREWLAHESTQQAALEAYLVSRSQVSEPESRKWFTAHQEEFTIPERVHASHIFLTIHDKGKPDREPEIREIYQRLIRKEATFSELAAAYSEDERTKNKGGDLDWMSRERLRPEFADKLFSLSSGELSVPFKSTLGWHIVYIQDRKAARPADFSEAQPEIKAMLESKKREMVLAGLLQELRQKARISTVEATIRKTEPTPQ